jgi:hypothetical protein
MGRKILLSALFLIGAPALAWQSPAYERIKAEDQRNQYAHSVQLCNSGYIAPWIRRSIYKNFDPKCLSNTRCVLAYEVTFTDKEVQIEKLRAENDTPSDDFYCEEAISEYVFPPDTLRANKLFFEFNAEPSDKYGYHPELYPAKDFVSLHLVPLAFIGRDILFENEDRGILNRLVYLEADRLADARLAAFRKDRSDYILGHHSSVQRITGEALELQKKYEGLLAGTPGVSN